MTRFKFSKGNWKTFFLFIILNSLIVSYLQSQFEFGMVALMDAGIITILFLFFRQYFTIFDSVVGFQDSFLLLKEGLFKKEVRVNYSEISKMVFTHNKALKLWVYVDNKKVELPSPHRVGKAEELFQWLATKNPQIAFQIIRPKEFIPADNNPYPSQP
ncbi:hypothetical protein [Adhaeribacter rhizoryzae]|uniref:Uncharacterized protein n=1 Tax=Adhaeribacter rhizoryzae TaxID=2607907 RepID=A0A5M6DSG7_9BACT|nr:hypothetical protein [Adhaeribacter rhizoryzae]KAA5548355.1 hypothetical protein F0145_06415 [Adhaeribacter rhizoryzae]